MNIVEQLPILNQLPGDVRDFILRLLVLVIALLVVVVLRRIVKWALLRPLRQLTAHTATTRDDVLVDRLVQPIRYVVLAIGISLTVGILDFGADIRSFGDHLARSLIVVALMLALYRLIDIVAFTPNELLRFTGVQVEERLLPFIRTAFKVLLIALAALVIVQEWGYDATGLIASLGVVGLALSLAAKDTAENVFGFTAIVSDNPFKVGDFIVHPDVTGTVERVGVRSTRVRQLDQALVSVPNNRMAQATVTNWSRLSKRWYNHTVGVTYSTNSGQMRELLHRIGEMLRGKDKVDPTSVFVHFIEFGDSSLQIQIRAYMSITDYNEYITESEDIHMAIMDIVAEMGLSIAFPSRSIYMENMPEQDENPPNPAPPSYPERPKPSAGSALPSDTSDDGGADR